MLILPESWQFYRVNVYAKININVSVRSINNKEMIPISNLLDEGEGMIISDV